MEIAGIHTDLTRQPGALPVMHGVVDATGWQAAASTVARSGGRLVALWGSPAGEAAGAAVHAAYAMASGLVWLELKLDADDPAYPGSVGDLSRGGADAACGARPGGRASRGGGRHAPVVEPRRLAG